MHMSKKKEEKSDRRKTGFKENIIFFIVGIKYVLKYHSRTLFFLLITIFAPYACRSYVFLIATVIFSIAYFAMSILDFVRIRKNDELIGLISETSNKNNGRERTTTVLWIGGVVLGVISPVLAWFSSITINSSIETSINSSIETSVNPLYLTMQLVLLPLLLLLAIISNFLSEIMVANWKYEERLEGKNKEYMAWIESK